MNWRKTSRSGFMKKLRALNSFEGFPINSTITHSLYYLSSKSPHLAMKIFNLIFCILFILFAGLQYNDPDPYIWIPIYLYAAILCWFAFRQKYFPGAYLVGVATYSIYAIYLFVAENGVWDWITKHQAPNIADTMKAEQPWIEDTREFFGLLILIVVLLINYFYAKRIGKKKTI
jgi:hypothetical protein